MVRHVSFKIQSLIFFFVALAVVTSGYSFFRPIWIDEVILFSLAPLGSFAVAWKVFVASIYTMNPGQTGAYHMVDYLLLNQFGASPWVLRLPSFLAMTYTYWLVCLLFSELKLSIVARWVGICLLFADPVLNGLASDARPYAFVVLGFTAGLLFFFSRGKAREVELKRMAYPALVLSALFHPYFSVYLFASWLLGWIYFRLQDLPGQSGIQRLWVYSSVTWIIPLIGIYGAISYLTWFGQPQFHFGFNPYQYLREGVSPVRSIVSGHLESFSWMGFSKVILIPWIAFFPMIFLKKKTDPRVRLYFLLGFAFFWISLGMTAIITWQSIRHTYWVLSRQWVGSIVGVIFSIVLSLEGFYLLLPNQKIQRIFSVTAMSGFLFLFGNTVWQKRQQDQLDRVLMQKKQVEAQQVGLDQRNSQPATLSSKEALEWALLNTAEGGRVWPVFSRFYGYLDEEKLP